MTLMKNLYSRYGIVTLFITVMLLLCSVSAEAKKIKVSINEVSSEFSYRKWQQNAILDKEPSQISLQVLRQKGLDRDFQKDPLNVLRRLDREVCQDRDRSTLFALSELSYLTANQLEKRNKARAFDLYMGTVRYSYFYLFDDELGPLPNTYDPRFRMSCDLYNYGLAKLFSMTSVRSLSDDRITISLIDQEVSVRIKRNGFLWNQEDFGSYQLATDYEVKGLFNQYRTFGLGVPIIVQGNINGKTNPVNSHRKYYFTSTPSFSATAFLRVEDSLCHRQIDRTGRGAMVMELYNPLRIQTITINGQSVPLESDLTTPLGYFLSRNPAIDSISLSGLLKAEKVQHRTGVYMLEPYDPEKIPVVFIHGLISSPMAWMQMVNELRGDPVLREHYQFWFFQYPTGNPYLLSASQLYSSLTEIRNTFDPEKKDPSFDQMVLVGHSMGGLLSKRMTTSSGGEEFWNSFMTKPIEDIDAKPKDRELIKEVFVYEPLPEVKRVVYICTPHRGSKASVEFIGRLAIALIKLPGELVDVYNDIFTKNPDILKYKIQSPNMTSSVASLSPNNIILTELDLMKRNPEVKYHSIIADLRKEKGVLLPDGTYNQTVLSKGTDGYVPYSSSHQENVESENVIFRTDHRSLDSAKIIRSVKKILHLHLESSPVSSDTTITATP